MTTDTTKPQSLESLLLDAEAALAFAEAYHDALGDALARGAGGAEVDDLAANLRAAVAVCRRFFLALLARAMQLSERADGLRARARALDASAGGLLALPAA